VQLISGEVRDDGQDFGEISKWFHAVEFAGGKNRIYHG
jgi:hypothetical protein